MLTPYRLIISLLLLALQSFLGSSVAKIELTFLGLISLVLWVWNKIKMKLTQPVPWNMLLDFPVLVGGVLEI